MPDFSVTRMHTECLDDFDKDFMAKHEEGLGDVWSAVLSDDDDIVQYLEKIISKGRSRKEWSSSINGKRAVLIQYPERSPIRAGALLAKAEDGGDFELYSCYPVFKGIINNLKILKTHAWKNGVEGTVAARSPVDEVSPISFFDPYFFRDHCSLGDGSIKAISLSGLALACKKVHSGRDGAARRPLVREATREIPV